jgi:hypothetical protein
MQQLQAAAARRSHPQPPARVHGAAVEQRAARAALREQIARLERKLTAASAASFPEGGIDTAVPRANGGRLLTLGELEIVRDALAARLTGARLVLEERAREREHARVTLERMLLAPGDHRRVRISQRELGEPGCGVWHVRPRLGLVGMLMGWWQVKLSSGCPLAT